MRPDERLLELRAKFRASGSLEDEVLWLGARAQVGEIAPKRLAFAALLGDPAAIQVAGAQTPHGVVLSHLGARGKAQAYLEAWGREVGKMGWLVATRALLGFALKQLEDLRNSPAFVPDPNPDPFDRSIPRQELAPAHARLALRFADRLQSVLVEGERASLTTGHWQIRLEKTTPEIYLAGTALHMIVRSLHQRSAEPFVHWWSDSYLPSLGFQNSSLGPFELPPNSGTRMLDEEEVEAAIDAWRNEGKALGILGYDLSAMRQELVPAVLGYYDPIRNRLDRSLEGARVAHPCPLPNALEPSGERVRRCQECKLNVFDLRGLEPGEAEALLHTATNRFCVSLYQRQDGEHQTEECPESWSAATRQRELESQVDGFFDFSVRDPFENPFADPFSDPDPYRHPQGQDSIFGADQNPYAPEPEDPFAPPSDPFAQLVDDPFAPPVNDPFATSEDLFPGLEPGADPFAP